MPSVAACADASSCARSRLLTSRSRSSLNSASDSATSPAIVTYAWASSTRDDGSATAANGPVPALVCTTTNSPSSTTWAAATVGPNRRASHRLSGSSRNRTGRSGGTSKTSV